jgi:hypothetical protein
LEEGGEWNCIKRLRVGKSVGGGRVGEFVKRIMGRIGEG